MILQALKQERKITALRIARENFIWMLHAGNDGNQTLLFQTAVQIEK